MCQEQHQQQQQQQQLVQHNSKTNKTIQTLSPSSPLVWKELLMTTTTTTTTQRPIRKSVSFNEKNLTVVSVVETLGNTPFYTQEEIETFRAEAYMEKILKSTGRPAPVHRPLLSMPTTESQSKQSDTMTTTTTTSMSSLLPSSRQHQQSSSTSSSSSPPHSSLMLMRARRFARTNGSNDAATGMNRSGPNRGTASRRGSNNRNKSRNFALAA